MDKCWGFRKVFSSHEEKGIFRNPETQKENALSPALYRQRKRSCIFMQLLKSLVSSF